ncbi:thioredoxin family protein [Neorhodopirellula lusitana]|uniref:thioredoxin family protein n=1 Tax=Neorhodopirellula lusitana TaxID=445327 RepID=UPI00384BC885
MRLAWPRHIKSTVLLTATCLLAPVAAQAEIAWQSDLATAHAQAKAQNKPLLLHFYSDNCVWCDRLEAGAFQSPQVDEAIAQGFVPVKVHAGKSPELAKMFKVTKFPTDVVVTPSGESLAHGVSPQDPNRYVGMLASAGSKMLAMQPKSNLPVNAAGSYAMQQVPSGTNPHVHPGQANSAPATAAMAQSGAPVANPYHQPTGPLPGGASARLAGARTDGMTLGMPGQMMDPPSMETVAEPQAAAPKAAAAPASTPKLAMEGYCAVTVIDEDKWEEGNPKFGVVHLGKLYLFGSAEKMDTFLADPTPYTPVLNEIDVVRFFEERQIVPGKRRFGMRDPIHQRMFFFADEAAMNHFFNEYERYTDAAIEVMAQAVKDANPTMR